MVIVLMRYSANPYILDSEGLNCLHVAAQLGFVDIAAYYAAKGMVSGRGSHVGHVTTTLSAVQEVDVKDANGMTPLMHAASRCYRSARQYAWPSCVLCDTPTPSPSSADTVRLLVSLDSSVSAVDTEGNTGVCGKRLAELAAPLSTSSLPPSLPQSCITLQWGTTLSQQRC